MLAWGQYCPTVGDSDCPTCPNTLWHKVLTSFTDAHVQRARLRHRDRNQPQRGANSAHQNEPRAHCDLCHVPTSTGVYQTGCRTQKCFRRIGGTPWTRCQRRHMARKQGHKQEMAYAAAKYGASIELVPMCKWDTITPKAQSSVPA